MAENSGWLEPTEKEMEDGEPDNVDHQSEIMYGNVTEDMMKIIVDKISAEILQSYFISQIVR